MHAALKHICLQTSGIPVSHVVSMASLVASALLASDVPLKYPVLTSTTCPWIPVFSLQSFVCSSRPVSKHTSALDKRLARVTLRFAMWNTEEAKLRFFIIFAREVGTPGTNGHG